MWITTCHRFTNRAAYLAACLAAGWHCPPGQDPEPPLGVALDILGPIVASAQVDKGGVPITGEAFDPRYHVNLVWHGRKPDAAFQASLVVPATPSRNWDIASPPASPPPMPWVFSTKKGNGALGEAGQMDAIEAAGDVAGSEVQDAWSGALERDRHNEFLRILASVPSLTPVR